MAEYFITERQAIELAKALADPRRVYLLAGEAKIAGKRVVKFGALPEREGLVSEVIAIVIVSEEHGVIWP